MNLGRLFLLALCLFTVPTTVSGQDSNDLLREFQYRAAELGTCEWVHWGDQPGRFSNCTNHSNRLVPVYTFGLSLDEVQGENSIYRDEQRLAELYGQSTKSTVNEKANYFDQTEIYTLQKKAWQAGKKHVILMVFDGMDWQTTQAAATYRNQKVLYTKGRGTGLKFLDYRADGLNDYGFCVTSPHNGSTKYDVNSQTVTDSNSQKGGGYSAEFGGQTPWAKRCSATYLIGKDKSHPHPQTDSAASATSLNSGIKTYNSAINVSPDGEQVETLARQMQKAGYSVGAVTNVPFSHATPASFYANNVNRSDYQDISRDMLGLKSIAHMDKPLSGLDVLIGGGWGEDKKDDRAKQGANFSPGNIYIAKQDLKRIDEKNGGQYVVVQRTADESGPEILAAAASKAAQENKRLFGMFGVEGGHFPYQTADGNYDPTRGVRSAEVYTDADISENPTLADMTSAALAVLEKNEKGFFLCVEAGDIDWANHNNNIDDSIGAVFTGDDAFQTVVQWVEKNSNWDETCLILTSDHGHMMVLDDLGVFCGECALESQERFQKLLESKRAKDEEARKKKEAAEARKKKEA